MLTRRKILGSLAAISASACSVAPKPTVSAAPSVPREKRLFIDGLSFLRGNPADLKTSGLNAAIVDVSRVSTRIRPDGSEHYLRSFKDCDASITETAELIDAFYPSAFIARKGSDISKDGIALFLQFQSCEPIGDDLSRLAYFYAKGLRVLQLTHHGNNLFAGGALEANQSGLTPLGRSGIAEMNRLGILPDVSHASDQTLFETVEASSGPVILSHGACRALLNNPRCASDDMIRAIANSGGAMGVFMLSFWLTDAPIPKTEHYLAHLKHIVNIGGMDAVAIANDFSMGGHDQLIALGNNNAEGAKYYHDWWANVNKRGVWGFETLPQHVVIPELNNIDRMARIEAALEADSFFKSADIDKIMGNNWARVLRETVI